MRQRGFTLIELLAAITLLAVLSSILMGTVRGAERSTTAATEMMERTEQYSRAQAFLREHISGTLPMRWRREVNQPLKFSGGKESVTYLAPIVSQIAAGGVQWWQLATQRGNGKSQLVLRRRPLDPEEKAVPETLDTEVIVLADNIESLTISYFDAGEDPINNPDNGAWRDAWEENARMPVMLRLQVMEAGRRPWPDLIIPLKLTQAIGCNFDFQRQRCVILAGAQR